MVTVMTPMAPAWNGPLGDMNEGNPMVLTDASGVPLTDADMKLHGAVH